MKVKCVSPHGGCHYGQRHDGNPVHPVWDGKGEWVVPILDEAQLRLPPNPGGYIDNAVLGTCAVGREYDAPVGFVPDGFHFIEVQAAPPAAKIPEE